VARGTHAVGEFRAGCAQHFSCTRAKLTLDQLPKRAQPERDFCRIHLRRTLACAEICAPPFEISTALTEHFQACATSANRLELSLIRLSERGNEVVEAITLDDHSIFEGQQCPPGGV
jgi:hypothetical protein